jgi:hypothetical protein
LQKHKLFLVLNSLTSQERRSLEKFLQSAFFNNRKQVLSLYQFLQQKKQPPSKESIFQELFPNEKYKDEKVRLVMSLLLKKIEQFLSYQYQQEQDFMNNRNLALVYQNKKLYKLFGQTIKNTRKQEEEQTYRNGQHYFNKYLIGLDEYNLSATVRTMEHNLQEVSDSLDTSFIILKLQQACLSISHQAVYQQDYQLGMIDLILKYVRDKELYQLPAIGIYYHCFLALSSIDATENFKQFKYLLFEFRKLFPKSEWRDLFVLATNICIRIINDGDISYLKEILELYKKGLATAALLENGILSRFVYQNITTSGLRTGDFDWTRQFLIDYKEKVEKNYRESAFRFNMARLAYHQKKYTQALDLLRDADQEDMLINLYSKSLLLKIYYETEAFKLLDSFLDAFKIYLRRKNIIPLHKNYYKRMIYYTQKLMKVNPYDKEAKQRLKERIEAEKDLRDKGWLLGQLGKL